MKITIVCQSYPPMVSGAALVIHRLAEGLAEHGHSMLVLSSSDQGSRYIEYFYGLENYQVGVLSKSAQSRSKICIMVI